MHLVYSLEEPPDANLPSIFLAGPTPRQRSNVRSWRPRVVKILKRMGFKGIVFIPENRHRYAKINYKEQPKWEHRMLNRSSCILFWVPRDLKKLPGFTTNVEFGLFARSGKTILGAPTRAQKIDYLRFVANEFSIPQYWTLGETVRASVYTAYCLHRFNYTAAKTRNYLYCPFCASRLKTRKEENKERKYCPDCKWTYYPSAATAVIAVVKKSKNKVVMVKRNREPFKNTWGFPAGFVEYGEHPLDALHRELREETGLKMRSAKLESIHISHDDPRNPKHTVLVYSVQATGKLKNNDKHENQEVRWQKISNANLVIGWKIHKQVLDGLRTLHS